MTCVLTKRGDRGGESVLKSITRQVELFGEAMQASDDERVERGHFRRCWRKGLETVFHVCLNSWRGSCQRLKVELDYGLQLSQLPCNSLTTDQRLFVERIMLKKCKYNTSYSFRSDGRIFLMLF